MSRNETILNVDVTPVASITNYTPTDISDYALSDTAIIANDGREAVYTKFTDADAFFGTTARIGRYPTKDKQRVSHSVRLTSPLQLTDDSSGVDVVSMDEISGVLAITGPTPTGGLTADNLVEFVFNLVSWWLTTTGTELTGDPAWLYARGVVSHRLNQGD